MRGAILFYAVAVATQPLSAFHWDGARSNIHTVGPRPSTSCRPTGMRHGRRPLVTDAGTDFRAPAGTGGTALRMLPAGAGPPASALGSVCLLCAVVLIHEAGHFLAARSFGIEIDEFSVGIGPRLLGFVSGGVQYSLRALPLGGYVAFPPNYNATAAFEDQMKYERSMEEYEQYKGDRSLSEGEVEKTNGNFLSRLFSSTPPPPPPPPIRPEKTPIQYDQNPNLLQNRPTFERGVVLVGGIVFNLILSFSLYFTSLTAAGGLLTPILNPGIAVIGTVAGSPALNQVSKGDIITRINGIDLAPYPTQRITMAVAQKSVRSFVDTIHSTPTDGDVLLSVLKGGITRDIRLRPEAVGSGLPSIGVTLSPNLVSVEKVRAASPAEGVRKAAAELWFATDETASTFFGLISSIFISKPAGAPAPALSGPVGIIRAGSDAVGTGDVAAVLAFAAALSVNLAVINALPFPGLDGGQLAFVLAETLRGGKGVDQRTQEEVTSFFLAALGIVSLSTIVGDVSTLFK